MRRQPEEFRQTLEQIQQEVRQQRLLFNKLVEEFVHFRHSMVFAATKINLTLEDLVQAITSSKVKQSETKDVAKEIEMLLSKRSMTFTELFNELKISSATLTKYLNELVQQGKIERKELDKTVLYSLKG